MVLSRDSNPSTSRRRADELRIKPLVTGLYYKYLNIRCKGEPYRFSGLEELLIQTPRQIYCYFYTRIDSRTKTMADKLIFIPNEDTQNYSFCSLQLVVEKLGHST